MATSARSAWGFVAFGLLLAAVGLGYLAYRVARGTAGPTRYVPTSAPTSQPTETTTTKPAPKPHPATTLIDIIKADHPYYAVTRPLSIPLRDLSEGARIVLHNPVFLGPSTRADLWITRRDSLPIADVLQRAMDRNENPQVHVVPEVVRFVHWHPDEPNWTPYVVTPRRDGRFDLVSPKDRLTLDAQRRFEWERAISWGGKIIVPSEAGVSVIHVGPALKEDYYALLDSKDVKDLPPEARPQALLDFQGVIAWAPAMVGYAGSHGAVRYIGDKWVELGPQQNWPQHILQLVPLRDGSVLQIISQPQDGVTLALTTLYVADVSEQKIAALVEQMSDVEAEKREAASKQLSQYGPGIHPLLKRLADDQPPEARRRLQSLMRNQVRPTLGGMSLIGAKLITVTRQNDGGVTFFAPEGVAIPQEDSTTPIRRTPAWISLRPGRAAEALDSVMVSDLNPQQSEIYSLGSEWISTGTARGPMRWMGNEFLPLLRKSEATFSDFLGIDRRGRWLFHRHDGPDETLIIDPTLPDPTPKLPFWEIANARSQGWDAMDWPAIRREGGDWSLRESGWLLLDPKKNQQMLTELPPQFRPTTTDSQPIEPPILIDDQGTRYFDGKQSLRTITKDGRHTTWPLPPSATGNAKPTLLRTPGGILFLFNQPGRILRIRPTPDEPEPFFLEATFTRKIPSVEQPTRIWLDPAGRICMTDARRLIVFFPAGYIPPAIRDMMPLSALEMDE